MSIKRVDSKNCVSPTFVSDLYIVLCGMFANCNGLLFEEAMYSARGDLGTWRPKMKGSVETLTVWLWRISSFRILKTLYTLLFRRILWRYSIFFMWLVKSCFEMKTKINYKKIGRKNVSLFSSINML